MAETILAIAIILLAAIVSPALADTDDIEDADDAQAGGVPSLAVRYAVVESKIGLTTGTIDAIILLDSRASHLETYKATLIADLATLKTFVDSKNAIEFNTFIRERIHPDMQAAHKAIITDKQQFKAWGIHKNDLKKLKDECKELKNQYRVGKYMSQAARGKKGIEVQNYLNKAGIEVEADPSPTPVPSVEPTPTPAPTAEPTETPTPTDVPTPSPTPTATP